MELLFKTFLLFVIFVAAKPHLKISHFDFKFYVFAMQYPGTFCLNEEGSCHQKMPIIPKKTMTIHGLWASWYPIRTHYWCHKGCFIQVDIQNKTLLNEMDHYWVGLSGTNTDFWEHEYNKHGYCWSVNNNNYNIQDFFQQRVDFYFGNQFDKIFFNGEFDNLEGEQR